MKFGNFPNSAVSRKSIWSNSIHTWCLIVLYIEPFSMHSTLIWYWPFIFSVTYQATTLYNRSCSITPDINFKVHDAGRCVNEEEKEGVEKKNITKLREEKKKELELLTMMTATQPEEREGETCDQCAHSSTFYHLTTTASTPSWLMDIATRIRLLGHLFWNLNDIETSCKLLGWRLQSLRKTGKDHFQRET